MKVLLALDGSKRLLKSIEFLIDHAGWCREKPEIELVTVHLPVARMHPVAKAISVPPLMAYAARRRLPCPCARRALLTATPKKLTWSCRWMIAMTRVFLSCSKR